MGGGEPGGVAPAELGAELVEEPPAAAIIAELSLPKDMALENGVLPPTFCPAPPDVGKIGGIPGLVEDDVVVVVVDVAVLDCSPGVTAAAASLTNPTMPPNKPPAA